MCDGWGHWATVKRLAIAFAFVDRKVTEAVNWREGNKMKERCLSFYVKNRAGEFSRATTQHVELVEDFMEGEVDTPSKG